MPFIAKDWRSSGDTWIKTEQGWQTAKSLQFLASDPTNLQSRVERMMHSTGDDWLDEEFKNYNLNETNHQLCIYLDLGSIAPNRENSEPQLTISDVLIKLDFVGGALKLKQFNYIYNLISLIVTDKFENISGTAQSTVLLIINMMLNHVLNTRIHIHLIKTLLVKLKEKIKSTVFNHFGSKTLWENHSNLINRWLVRLENYEKKFWAKNDNEMTINSFSNLPVECKLEIIKRVDSGYDLVSLSKCNKEFYDIIGKEESLWKKLCFYSFDSLNILKELKKQNIEIESEDELRNRKDLNWKLIYFKLKRRHISQEIYVDFVVKCNHCKCLFWKETGHPCADEEVSIIESLTPKNLIDLMFSKNNN